MVGNVEPMRVVMLHSHPLEDSYSAAIRDRGVEALEAAGHSVELHRLGNGREQGPTAANLHATDALVLVHPTWWGSQPAPLLGWIQRELGPWLDGPGRPREPSPVRSIRHLVAVTTHGSSKLLNRLQGEPGRKLLERGVVPLCAPDVSCRWLALYKLDRIDRAGLEAFIDRVGEELGSLEPQPD